MVNSIRAEIYKLTRRSYSYILLLCCAAFALLVAGLMCYIKYSAAPDVELVNFPLAINMLSMGMPIGLYLVAVGGDAVFSEQYKYNTLKNEVSYGLPRVRVYLSRLVVTLLLMLVALMVSAVVVAGASSAVSALRTDQKQEQAALTVTSAAELIRNSFLASDMKYVSTTVSYEFYYNSNQNTSSTTTQTIPAELAFSDFANYAIGRLRDGQPVLNRVYTFHLEDDRVSDVTATFSMTYDTLDSGETRYVLTAVLESTDPDAPYRMTLVMPSAVTTSTSVNAQRFYKMTTTVETISWTDGGTIHRKEAGS